MKHRSYLRIFIMVISYLLFHAVILGMDKAEDAKDGSFEEGLWPRCFFNLHQLLITFLSIIAAFLLDFVEGFALKLLAKEN